MTDNQIPEGASLKGAKTKQKVRSGIIWSGAGMLFFVLAGFIESFDRKLLLPALGVLIAGFVFFGRSLWIALTNHGSTHRRANFAFGIVILLGLVVCGSLSWWLSRESKSDDRLSLGMQIGDDRSSLVFFTNDFLFPANTNSGIFSDVGGYIFVSASLEQSSITVTFDAINDSPLAANGVYILIWLPKNWQCSPGTGWVEGDPSAMRSENGALQSFAYTFPQGIVKRSAQYAPPIELRLTNTQPSMGAALLGSMGTIIDGDNFNRKFMTFNLEVVRKEETKKDLGMTNAITVMSSGSFREIFKRTHWVAITNFDLSK